MLAERAKDELYCIYEHVFLANNIGKAKKRVILTAIFGWDYWSWPIVGITESALRAFKENEWSRPAGLLSRDHPFPRAETFDQLLQSDNGSPWPKDILWRHILKRDKTVLMTNSEHRARKSTRFYFPDFPEIQEQYERALSVPAEYLQISRIYPIDHSLGLFQDLPGPGFRYRIRSEGKYLQEMWESIRCQGSGR
jgi:hypothetical protein